jgi:hypothetical protein
MIAISSLWLAILLSAVVVWVAGAIVWMVLPHHRSDYRGFPDEEAVRQALGPDLAPGQYNIPHIPDRKDADKPEVKQMFAAGPIGFMTVLPRGFPSMGKGMILSFVFYLLISATVAYVLTRTLPVGAEPVKVLQIGGTVAWLGYGTAVVQDAIWFGRPWSAVGKQLLDAFIYGLATGAVFAWLWPA